MRQLEPRLRGGTIPPIPKEQSMAVLESSHREGSQKADMPSSPDIFVFRTLVYSKEGGDRGRAEQGNQRGLLYVYKDLRRAGWHLVGRLLASRS